MEQNLTVIFLTGLLTGGLTCLAVQGGLLAATIAQREEARLKEEVRGGHARPILFFLLAKLVAYTILGFLLGWFGSLFELSVTAKIVMQAAVAVFMAGTALNMLGVHRIFRYFVLQPPTFLTRLIRNQSKSRDVFAPAVLGAFTVFIPCGTTQAMMALAIGSGSPGTGALILFSFVLGTSPLFFLLGYFATKLGERFERRFLRAAAVAILLLSIYTLKNVWVLSGTASPGASAAADPALALQEFTIQIEPTGYYPKEVTVRAGETVTLHLLNDDAYSCAQAFTIPKLGIQKVVQPGESTTIAFTAPKKPGQLVFACSMGMYRGVIHVI